MTREEIAGVLAELEQDLKKSASEIEASLAKADGPIPEDDAASAAGGEDSTSPAPDAGASAPVDAPPDASAGGMPPPDAGAAPADPAAAAGGQPLTPEALQAEYSQLPPEELDMHIQAALAAKEALQASAAPAPGAGMPPPPGAAPGAMPPPDASAGGMPPPPMGKEELKINSENTGGKISKSEEIIAAVLAKFETKLGSILAAQDKSNKEDIENLTKAMTIVLETPVRRAVTSLADVGGSLKKNEPTEMSRKQVDEFISQNASKMTKSERDLWLDFVDNKVPAAKLVPMLERLTSTK